MMGRRTIVCCSACVAVLIAVTMMGFLDQANAETTSTVPMSIRKCCEKDMVMIEENCTKTDDVIEFMEYSVFKSNETMIDDDEIKMNISVYYNNRLECPESHLKIGFGESDIIGIIYNSSLLLNTHEEPARFILLDEYCMEYEMSNVIRSPIFLVCRPDNTQAAGSLLTNIFVVLSIVSCLCFFTSAICYYWILTKKTSHKKYGIVHKKCFTAYSLCMGSTFFFLILLQKSNSGCGIMASLFFLSILSSFSWMMCLCIDLALLISDINAYPKDNFYWFLSVSMIFPICFYLFSLYPELLPDIPMSFIKQPITNESCTFRGQKSNLFYTPIIVNLIISLVCLFYSFYKFRRNVREYLEDYTWISHKEMYKYTGVKCSMVFILMTIFFLVEFITTILNVSVAESSFIYSLQIIGALQGCFVLSILFLHFMEEKRIHLISQANGQEVLALTNIQEN